MDKNHYVILDSVFDPSHMRYEKHVNVSYASALERLLEGQEDEDEDPLITVFETRSQPVVQLKKRWSQVADKVLEYCKQNEIIGYVNDW